MLLMCPRHYASMDELNARHKARRRVMWAMDLWRRLEIERQERLSRKAFTKHEEYKKVSVEHAELFSEEVGRVF